jgi:hypothetical protein
MLAPVVPLTRTLGGVDSRPPTGLSTGLPAAAIEAWGASGVRPTQALPCTRQGGVVRRFGFDATTATPLFADTAVLDTSIDYRRRDFTVRCSTKVGATQFAWQPGATPGAIPCVGMTSLVQETQSFVDDSASVLGVASRSAGVVFYVNNASLPGVAAGANGFGLYVPLSGAQAGNLCVALRQRLIARGKP